MTRAVEWARGGGKPMPKSDGGSPAGRDPIPVTIHGRTYHLRGDEDAEYLAKLAAHVDERMDEVAVRTGTADTAKLAILASLNIADDYFKARRGRGSSEEERTERRLARMVELLDEALAG